MKVQYKEYNLKFRYPFGISKGTKTNQPTLVVCLEHMGYVGWGEAPAITYYDISIAKMIEDLERKRVFLEKYAFTDPDRYWHYLHHLFPANPFLVCALDMAGWDIHGKMRRKQLSQFWQTNTPLHPVTDYTIGIDTVERMVEKMNEKPWPVYKIKLGTDNDIEIVRALRANTAATFRIDANAAWTAEEALKKIPHLKELGVEFIEQPLAKDDWEGMKVLFEASTLPLIADESCVGEADVDKCVGHFHGINIKLTKCSGITPALRMIENGRARGLRIMLGSMNESTIGSAALAHLMHLADYVDADGPLLLEEDVATGLTYNGNGTIDTSAAPGLGIQFTNLFQRP
jgi:L-alanine-DL-glutamate epimerase-like enolase superfamily enzyme